MRRDNSLLPCGCIRTKFLSRDIINLGRESTKERFIRDEGVVRLLSSFMNFYIASGRTIASCRDCFRPQNSSSESVRRAKKEGWAGGGSVRRKTNTRVSSSELDKSRREGAAKNERLNEPFVQMPVYYMRHPRLR